MRNREQYSEVVSTGGRYTRLVYPHDCDGNDEPDLLEESRDDFVRKSTHAVMNDVVTAEYHRKSAEGQIINSPMDRTTTILRDNPYTYRAVYESVLWNTGCSPSKQTRKLSEYDSVNIPSTAGMADGWDTLPQFPEYDDVPIHDQAVTSAWANVDLSEVQALVALAESGKTVASLVSIAKRLIKIMIMIKKGDVKGLMSQLTAKQLSERYMELRYAIRPLLYDIQGFAFGLQTESILRTKSLRHTFRGWNLYTDSGCDDFALDDWVYTNEEGTLSHSEEYHHEWSLEVDVRAGVLVAIEELNRIGIYGLTQPFESAWELVPFSFVIDRFLNIGDMISAWAPEMGTRALASWYVQTTSMYQSLEHSHGAMSTYNWPGNRHWTNDCSRVVDGCWIDKSIVKIERVPEPIRAVVPSFSLRLDTFFLIDLLIIIKKLVLKDRASFGSTLRI